MNLFTRDFYTPPTVIYCKHQRNQELITESGIYSRQVKYQIQSDREGAKNMSKKDGYSRRGLFGSINHYDSNGKKVGESRPGLFGGMNNYDANGHKTGSSQPGLFGGVNHYDNRGHKTGSSQPGLFGSMNHYASRGNRTQ